MIRTARAAEIGTLYRSFPCPVPAGSTILAVQSSGNSFRESLIYLKRKQICILALGLYYVRAGQDTANREQLPP